MILYHGSNVTVAEPNLDSSRKTLDFGSGFYTTTHRKQAITFAGIVCNRKGGKKNISQYIFDKDKAFLKLKTKTFEKADEQWLDFVVANRNGIYKGEEFDIIQGPVANDKVFSTVVLYTGGQLSKQAALEALKPFKLYDQIVFKTAAALAFLQFKTAEDVK
jgi:hypothetical protein